MQLGTSTHNCMVYGELGVLALQAAINKRRLDIGLDYKVNTILHILIVYIKWK